jgi:hypothetical protein
MIKAFKNFYRKTGAGMTRHARRAQCGASLLETIIAIALVTAFAPYVYARIMETSVKMTDVAIAKKIVAYESRAMNYVRLNQDLWTGTARIRMDAEEANAVLETEPDESMALGGMFINKDKSNAGSVFEVFLDFNIAAADDLRVSRIARSIGGDAGTVTDGAAYGVYGNWSARSDVFQDGDLVYRISENIAAQDSDKFLHRTVLGDEKLNSMARDLSVGGNIVYNIGEIIGESARITNATVFFANADVATARELVFPSGANMDPSNSRFRTIRVIGDIVGFRNFAARRLTGRGGTGNWARQGSIIADRANISDSVHVGENLYIRTNSARTISGFSGATAHSVFTPYLSTEQLSFAPGFGITISSELMSSSSGVPLKLGAWSFPSNSMPRMNKLILGRRGNADIALETAVPKDDFIKLISDGWKDLRAKQPIGTVESSENE